MKYIGYDIGRANTGITIYDSISKVVHYMTVELPISKVRSRALFNPTSCRLDLLKEAVTAFMCAHLDVRLRDNDSQYNIEEDCLAIVEDYAYGDQKITLEEFRKMDKMSLEVGETAGVIYQTIFNFGIPMIKVAPSQMKYFVTGNGRCEKTQIIKAMYEIYKVSMEDDHQYDALALCHIGRYFTLFCKNQEAIPEGTYEYNVVTRLAYDQKYVAVSKMFGLNL